MAKQKKNSEISPFQEQLLQFQEAEKQANEVVTNAEIAYNNALLAKPQNKEAIEQAKQNLDNAKEERDTVRSHTQRVSDLAGTNNNQLTPGQKTWNNVKSVTKNAANASVNNTPTFNDSFYRDVAAAIKGTMTGNQNDVNSDTAKAQSQNKQTQAGQHQMAEQQARQKAEQNNYSEAGKIASVQNDAENRQNVQKSGVLGSGAALMRATNAPDVQTQKNYAMQQQNIANNQMELANDAQQRATEFAGLSNNYKVASRDEDTDNDTASRLARGAGTANTITTNTGTASSGTGTASSGTANTNTNTNANTNAGTDTANTPVPQDSPEQFSTDWQSVLNYMTYGADPSSGWSNGSNPNATNAANFVKSKGWSPLTPDEVSDIGGYENQGALQDKMQTARPDFYKEWQQSSNRYDENGNLKVAGTDGNTSESFSQNSTFDYPSDERVKNIYCQLSDMRMKWIKEDYERDGKLDDDALDWLMRQAGSYTHGDRRINSADDFTSPDDMSVLAGYADFIHNYLYNYKPEAQDLDSSIDPEQDQIGPMAQDIEKVNPACITETPEGVKTVDTRKLALMNAGAIGDIARQLNELSEKLKALGV